MNLEPECLIYLLARSKLKLTRKQGNKLIKIYVYRYPNTFTMISFSKRHKLLMSNLRNYNKEQPPLHPQIRKRKWRWLDRGR